jgi:hypothetical protein
VKAAFALLLCALAQICLGQTVKEPNSGQASQGPSVDKIGNPVIDPTENVKALMKASLEALALLRAADEKYLDATVLHLKEIAELRAKHAEQLRLSDLTAADKTRQVDVMAAASSATALATAVSALQATTDRNAETLRNSVISSAASVAKQTSDAALATQTATDNLFRRMDERMALLERNAATGAGRQSVADPQVEAMNTKLNQLLESRATGAGKSEGMSNTVGFIIAGAGLLLAVITVFLGRPKRAA